MVDGEIIGKSTEATKGGFQAILKIEGVLQPTKRVKSRFETGFGGKPAPDQAEIVLEEAVILKMEEGEPEPELKDDKFTTWMTYAQPGKVKPNVNTFFVKHFMKSGEELDAKRRGVEPKDGQLGNLHYTRVVLERQNRFLFKRPKEGGAEGEYDETWKVDFVFVDDTAGDSVDIKEHIKKLVLGKTAPAAKRDLIMDSRAKQHSEYRTALDDGTLAELLGLEVRDGKFAVKEA